MDRFRQWLNEEGAIKDLWNSHWIGVPLWIAFGSLTLYWFYCVPPPGYAIGALAVLAGIMSVREMKTLAKISWVFLLICLLIMEFRAIDKDRADNEQKQREFFASQKSGFSSIATQASSNFEATTSGLKTAINGLNGVLETTQGVASVAKKNLDAVSGGNSFAYFMPCADLPDPPPVTPVTWCTGNIVNAGDQPLSMVSLDIARLLPNGMKSIDALDTVNIGSIAPRGVVRLPYKLHPDSGPDGFEIEINAQNGSVVEDLYFRKPQQGYGWAYKFTVNRIHLDDRGNVLSVIPIKKVDWSEPVLYKPRFTKQQ